MVHHAAVNIRAIAALERLLPSAHASAKSGFVSETATGRGLSPCTESAPLPQISTSAATASPISLVVALPPRSRVRGPSRAPHSARLQPQRLHDQSQRRRRPPRRVIDVIAGIRDRERRGGTPDEVGHVAALLMGQDGAFITGSDFLMDGGVTASYWFGELAPK